MTTQSVRQPTTASSLRSDPTRLAGLRRTFQADLKRRYASLKLRILHVVVTLDTFGLEDVTRNADVGNMRQAWRFETNDNKVKRYRAWLRTQMDSTLAGDKLIQSYIDQAYRKGVSRAYEDKNKGRRVKRDKESLAYQRGSKDQFTRTLLSREVTVQKVKLLAGRTFADLEDVNSRMATKISRVLIDGLVTKKTVKQIARAMVDEVDIEMERALTIARTELTRAHAEGQLDSLEELGETEVGAEVEYITAGDNRVCPLCSDLEGQLLPLDEARGIIPQHPNCRCAWMPKEEAVSRKGKG